MQNFVEVHAHFRRFFNQFFPNVTIRHELLCGHFIISQADFEKAFIPKFFQNIKELKDSHVGASCHFMDQNEFDEIKKNSW